MDRRLIDMTESDLAALVASVVRDEVARLEQPAPQRTASGLQGIADALKVSKSTAARMVKSGRLEGAIWRYGKSITMDVAAAKTLLTH